MTGENSRENAREEVARAERFIGAARPLISFLR